MSEKTYTLTCAGCGAIYKHIKKARVCTECGNVATLPILTDEQCGDILAGDGEAVKPNVKKENTKQEKKNRDPEKGGGVF